MQTEDFLNYVRMECKKHGVKLRLSNHKRVRSDGYCSGYFSADPPELAVARKSKEFWPVLVHEFCHMQQWLEDADVWINGTTSNGTDAWALMVNYIGGHDYDQDEIDQAFSIIIRCERDCDQRAVKMIKKYNLPIDTDRYIRQSNAYHYFYHIVKETRKWYGKEPIYSHQSILDLCEANFRSDPVRGIPDLIRREMMKYMKDK